MEGEENANESKTTGRGMPIYAYGTLRLLKIIFIRDAIAIKLQCTFSNKPIKVWLQ